MRDRKRESEINGRRENEREIQRDRREGERPRKRD